MTIAITSLRCILKADLKILLYDWTHIKTTLSKFCIFNLKNSLPVKFVFFLKVGYFLTYSIVSVCLYRVLISEKVNGAII